MKVWILQNQMRTEKQMRAAALRQRIFFFSLTYKKETKRRGKIVCVWEHTASCKPSIRQHSDYVIQ